MTSEITAPSCALDLRAPRRHDSYRRFVEAHRMVVDRFDPNPQRIYRAPQPVRLAVVGPPLLMVGAYRRLDIEVIESALEQPQQCVIGPYELLDRNDPNSTSSSA